jgi:ubiquinol-cytochrome c reductase cytochrome b subunit
MPADGGYVLAARILTLAYFAFFLVVLPMLGLREQTLPVPATIADAVLAKSGSASSVAAGAASAPQTKG